MKNTIELEFTSILNKGKVIDPENYFRTKLSEIEILSQIAYIEWKVIIGYENFGIQNFKISVSKVRINILWRSDNKYEEKIFLELGGKKDKEGYIYGDFWIEAGEKLRNDNKIKHEWSVYNYIDIDMINYRPFKIEINYFEIDFDMHQITIK